MVQQEQLLRHQTETFDKRLAIHHGTGYSSKAHSCGSEVYVLGYITRIYSTKVCTALRPKLPLVANNNQTDRSFLGKGLAAASHMRA